MRQPAEGVHSIQAGTADIQQRQGQWHRLPAPKYCRKCIAIWDVSSLLGGKDCYRTHLAYAGECYIGDDYYQYYHFFVSTICVGFQQSGRICRKANRQRRLSKGAVIVSQHMSCCQLQKAITTTTLVCASVSHCCNCQGFLLCCPRIGQGHNVPFCGRAASHVWHTQEQLQLNATSCMPGYIAHHIPWVVVLCQLSCTNIQSDATKKPVKVLVKMQQN